VCPNLIGSLKCNVFFYWLLTEHQLPAEGGTFFTAETRDAVKSHYRSVWSACLHAASLYLKQEGFGIRLNTDSLGSSAELSETDRFHLLLGNYLTAMSYIQCSYLTTMSCIRCNYLTAMSCIQCNYLTVPYCLGVAMEALCSRTSAQSDDTIITCLKSVYTLLTSKRESVVSPAISREILAVLHRLMLTRDNSNIRTLSINVLEQLVNTCRDSTTCEYMLCNILP